MNKLSFYLTASIFMSLSPATARAEENIILSALKSDFAIKVYAGVCIATGAYASKTVIDPLLAKYRQLTGTENLNELHNKVMLKEKWVELDKAEFEVQVAKITALREFLPTYEALMQKKINDINQSSSDPEKAKKIALIEARIKQTKEQLDQSNIEKFENLVDQTPLFLVQMAAFLGQLDELADLFLGVDRRVIERRFEPEQLADRRAGREDLLPELRAVEDAATGQDDGYLAGHAGFLRGRSDGAIIGDFLAVCAGPDDTSCRWHR